MNYPFKVADESVHAFMSIVTVITVIILRMNWPEIKTISIFGEDYSFKNEVEPKHEWMCLVVLICITKC